MRTPFLAECLANCGNRVKRKEAKYCCQQCQIDHQFRSFVRRWLAGEVDGTIAGWDIPSHHIRRYFIEKYGERCRVCGWAERNPRTGRIPVHLDHIDGNARNNTESNLRYLCPNHHALTETFGNCNKGNGRPGRRARYIKASEAPRGPFSVRNRSGVRVQPSAPGDAP
jgi:hypothetical protein